MLAPLRLVDVHLWSYSTTFERLVRLVPAQQPPERWWRLLGQPVGLHRLDDRLAAHLSLPSSRPAGPPIARLRLRAPCLAGRELPATEWDFGVLREAFEALGLDLDLLVEGFEPTGLRRLRFGALRAPFLSLDDRGEPFARATLTVIPLADNILVEVEHDRTALGGRAIAATDFHRIDPHPTWSAHLGNAAGLAAAVTLRALTTLDRGRRTMEGARADVERRLFSGVVETSTDGDIVANLRGPTRELLRLIETAGSLRDAAAAALAVAPVPPSEAPAETPFARALDQLDDHRRSFDALRADCRETASAASDAASMVSLAEQAVQGARSSTLQRALTIITAVVLLPGLVAAIFGANVALPGRDQGLGTLGLLLAMTAGGCGTAWLLNLVDRTRPDLSARRPLLQATLASSAAILALAAGVVWLLA